VREHRALPTIPDAAGLDPRVRQLIEGPSRPIRIGRGDGLLVVAVVAVVIGVGLVVDGGGGGGSAPPAAGTCSDANDRAGRASDAGFSEGSGLPGRTDSDLERELAGIAATGARYLRMDFDWSYLGREEGRLDWSPVDRVVREARRCGLEVLGLLAYTPEWARRPGGSGQSPPADVNDFAEFASAAVERYRPRGVRTWEIWNEPNLTFYWEPAANPTEYAALLVAAYDAIKAVDPEATVLTGGTARAADEDDGSAVAPVTFLEGIYAAGGGDHFDAVAHHPYSFPALPLQGGGENFADITPRLYEVMDEHGDGDLEIWGTEMGAPSTEVVTLDFLADYVTEAYEAWRDWSFTGPLIWYSYRDAGTDPDDPEDNFGLVRADFRPKEPALSAFAAVVRG
jgi:polysaccharide biosynthesis protein PslG